ncbi:MAG TPA: hypothetical protein VGA12_01340 [Burkholderiales bacterium]|jgi:hypothetical protein
MARLLITRIVMHELPDVMAGAEVVSVFATIAKGVCYGRHERA